jgi:hypothetical protein
LPRAGNGNQFNQALPGRELEGVVEQVPDYKLYLIGISENTHAG